MKHAWLSADLLQALQGMPLSSGFSTDRSLISVSAYPTVGQFRTKGSRDKEVVTEKRNRRRGKEEGRGDVSNWISPLVNRTEPSQDQERKRWRGRRGCDRKRRRKRRRRRKRSHFVSDCITTSYQPQRVILRPANFIRGGSTGPKTRWNQTHWT